jgi:RNA-directed DNA polymerase
MAEPKGTGAAADENQRKRRERSAEEIVSRYQARIVKAQKAGKLARVKHLQGMLAHSHSAKVVAVERVTGNKGGKTPGVDGETWLTPEKKAKGMALIRKRGYYPLPLRRIYILKKNGKKRPLGIPTTHDRVMQAIHLLTIDPVAECIADPNSYGFRRERACRDAIEQCFNILSGQYSAQWVLEGDIRACFDQIDHEWLISRAPMDKEILRKWLKCGYVESSVFYDTEEGTPQGGIISPVLANLALDGMEGMLAEKFTKHSRMASQNKVNMVRYADDFVITGSSRELLEKQVKPLVVEFLRQRGLELSEEKTLITHIDDGFDFLGQNVRKYNGKLIIKPSKKNVASFLAGIREVINGNKSAKAGHLIYQLNQKVVGWAIYHRHICAKETFSDVDDAIFKMLWRWCKRRHPNKPRSWVASKYFTSVPGSGGGNNWMFWGEVERANGEFRRVLLRRASSVRIIRHIKVKAQVNPYDPEWATYLEQRHSRPGTRPAKSKVENDYAIVNGRNSQTTREIQAASRP